MRPPAGAPMPPIYYVDVENHTGVESGSITKFDSITGYNNVLVVVDDKTAVAIIVEVGGGKNLIKTKAD